jgi:hypothetical protein
MKRRSKFLNSLIGESACSHRDNTQAHAARQKARAAAVSVGSDEAGAGKGGEPNGATDANVRFWLCGGGEPNPSCLRAAYDPGG